MVVPRHRKHQPSSSVHHRLESIELVLRNVVTLYAQLTRDLLATADLDELRLRSLMTV